MSDTQFGESNELLERVEAQETPKPPDAEKLLDGSSKTYEFALDYWQTSLGKKRSDVPFHGRSFGQRNSLIQENLNKLQTRDERENSDIRETPEDEPIDRQQLIVETTELIIEQSLADMVDARRQFHEAASLVQQFEEQVNAGELADISLLETAREAVYDLHASAITLEHYLARANDDVNGYDQFSRLNGLSERYTAFMRSSLEEYRVQSESTFASDQKQDQLKGTFEQETKSLVNAPRFDELLKAIDERIREEKTAGEEQVQPQVEDDTVDDGTQPQQVDAQKLLDQEPEEQPAKENPLLRLFRRPRKQKK